MKTTKNTLFFIFLLALYLTGCSSSSDSNSTTGIVPVSPSNLVGVTFSSTQINLNWTDNSTNETGFKIERRSGSSTYEIVGTVSQDILSYNDLGLTPNTTYTYRVYSFNTAGNSSTYTNEVTVTATALPSLTTAMAANITVTGVTSGGNITTDSGSAITARGVVWSTSTAPTIALTTKTSDGTGIGTFVSTITGLTSNTTYYVRSYATNAFGTGYGNEVSFTTLNTTVTDIDGNVYQYITIGTQVWTQTNLKVSKYRNGDPIPQVTDPTQWANLTTGAWCYYNNDPANGVTYGKLYNWYAVNDPRGLAPTGYHVPSNFELTTLTTFLGGEAVAGGKMKATTGWWEPNTEATNSSGFSGLPGGSRDDEGTFDYVGQYGGWWSSSEFGALDAFFYYLDYNDGTANVVDYYTTKSIGFSVRCIKD